MFGSIKFTWLANTILFRRNRKCFNVYFYFYIQSNVEINFFKMKDNVQSLPILLHTASLTAFSALFVNVYQLHVEILIPNL